MMLWKNLKAGTIVDACIGMSQRRAEKLESAGTDAEPPSAERQRRIEAGDPASEAMHPAE